MFLLPKKAYRALGDVRDTGTANTEGMSKLVPWFPRERRLFVYFEDINVFDKI